MAVPPRLAGQVMSYGSSSKAAPLVQHTLEIYLDYVCPFSAKAFKTLHTTVRPILLEDPRYRDSVRVIFRQQIQPWHPSSTLTHEAGLAVLRLKPTRFWDFSAALFERQAEYFDANVVGETRNKTYERLAGLAAESVGCGVEEVMGLLRVKDRSEAGGGGLNVGNGVTDDVKRMVKAARVVGVHVSPTVFFDGVEEKGISSSFTKEQWEEWLEKNVT